MDHLVRMAGEEDLEELIRLRFSYFEAENWTMTPAKRDRIEASLRGYIPGHLQQDFFAALVEVEGKTAAVAFLVVSERPASLSWPTGKTGMILNVLTFPAYRRRGFAFAAVERLITEAKEQNLSFLELSSSEAGKSMYAKMGFKEIDFASSHFTEMKLDLRQEP